MRIFLFRKVSEKCRFLLNDMRPYHTSKSGLSSLPILYCESNFKKMVRR